MKKLIIILTVLLISCEKVPKEKLEILSVTKNDLLVINYQVNEEIELAVYKEGDIPNFKLTQKGRYAVITKSDNLIFNWKEDFIKITKNEKSKIYH